MHCGRNAPLRDTFSDSWAAENAFVDIYEAPAPYKPRFQRGRQLARSLESKASGPPFTMGTSVSAVPGRSLRPIGSSSSQTATLNLSQLTQQLGSIPLAAGRIGARRS